MRPNLARRIRRRRFFILPERRQGMFQQVQLREGKEESEGGFCALVLVDAVFLEAVAAAATRVLLGLRTKPVRLMIMGVIIFQDQQKA